MEKKTQKLLKRHKNFNYHYFLHNIVERIFK